MAAAQRIGAVTSHLTAATVETVPADEVPDEFSIGAWRTIQNGGLSTLKPFDYRGGSETVEVTLINKVCLVEADPPGASPETADRLPVYTFTFANPPGPDAAGEEYESLGFQIDRCGAMKMVTPGYKAKSYSVSAERPGEFDLTIKIYPHGRASGYLNSLAIGDTVECWCKSNKPRNPGTHVGLIAYGVGITEILPMAAAELAKPDASQVRMLWASKTRGDTFWRDQIAALEREFPTQFSFVEIVSRDPDYAERVGALQGRVTAEAMRLVFDAYWGTDPDGPNASARSGVRYLNVAEKKLIKQTNRLWAELGYPEEQHKLTSDGGKGGGGGGKGKGKGKGKRKGKGKGKRKGKRQEDPVGVAN